jgi:toxin ParE1/3/4
LEQVVDGFFQIIKHPRRCPRYATLRHREVRRLLLDRFPYAIVYEMIDNRPVVLAVAHSARRPGYWRKRRPT